MTAMKRSTQKSSTDLNSSSANAGGDFQTERESSDRFLHLHAKLKVFDEIETDRESSASSEDMDSPRSVFSKVSKWPPSENLSVRVHSQILKIREEDSHLGEDVFEFSACRDKAHQDLALVLFSRPALSASPLSGKATAFNSISSSCKYLERNKGFGSVTCSFHTQDSSILPPNEDFVS